MGVIPLIFDHIRQREKSLKPVVFEYSQEHDMNVVYINGHPVPFVQMTAKKDSYSLELLTKTREEREEDDDRHDFLELYTKTEEERESDDESFSFLVNESPEGEDPREIARFGQTPDLLELYTKTKQERESDDEVTPIGT